MPKPTPTEHASESTERRRQVRGLLYLAVILLLLSLTRAGWHRVFTPGWWRP